MKTEKLKFLLQMVVVTGLLCLPQLVKAGDTTNPNTCTNCQVMDSNGKCTNMMLGQPYFLTNFDNNGIESWTAKADVTPNGGKVTYSLINSPDSSIDPDTGKLTPAQRSVDNKVTVTVVATLKDGGTTCQSTTSDIDISSCDGSTCSWCSDGGDPATISSAKFKLPLGQSAGLKSAGSLTFKYETVNAACGSPAGLTPAFLRSGVSLVRSYNGTLAEVHAPDVHIKIVTNSPSEYELRVYKTDFRNYSGGVIPAPPVKYVVTYLAPNGSNPNNRLQIVKWQTNLLTAAYVFSQNTSSGPISLSKGNGTNATDFLSIETLVVTGNTAGQTNKTFTLRDPAGNKIREYTEVYQTYPGTGPLLTQHIDDPNGAKLTHSWSYYINPTVTANYGKLQTEIQANGAWSTTVYILSGANQGLVSKVYSGFLNQSPTTQDSLCRVASYDYTTQAGDVGLSADRSPRMTVEALLGNEIRRSYNIIKSGERLDIQCQTPGAAWNAADNQVTHTMILTSGQFISQPWKVIRPDGTVTFYDYQPTASGGTVTTVTTGQPSSDGTTIVNGTRTVTVMGATHETLTNSVIDVASGLLIDQTVYSNFDDQNRAQLETYLDGTTHSRSYSCCGIASETDRHGVSSAYDYDALRRRIHTYRDGITTTMAYDAAGDVLSIIRTGTDNTQMVLNTNAYDVAGRTIASWNPATGLTTYQEVYTANQTVRTTTTADTATRIETSATDGSPLTVTGSAVHGSGTGYGVDSNGSYTVQTNGLNSSEWVKTYSDMVGRNYLTVYPDGASSHSYYNNLGQFWKQVDPDGVTTLFQYNAKGEQCFSAVEVDQNSVIDYAGSDRITWTTNFVTSDNGFTVQRTESYLWPTNSLDAPLLTSVSERAINGLYSWNTSFGLTSTNVTTVFGGGLVSSARYAPDGTYAISYSLNGRQIATTNFDANGMVLGWNTTGYDAHNRASTMTDGRNGTSTYTYVSGSDQVQTVTTPSPDGVASGLVTTTIYDSMGRPTVVTQPDNTSVTNFYYLTGEMYKTYGTRTYPVQYSYDYAGRMQTMTTWTNFASAAGAAITTWNYDSQRGWLNSKRYPDNKGPDYTYTHAGRLATRLWARTVGGNRLTTAYAYNTAGDLATINYNDGVTSSTTNNYTRRGQLDTVVHDGMTTSYAYNNAGQQTSEAYSGGWLNGFLITNSYDQYLRRSNMKGQMTGYNNYTNLPLANYTYDAASRLQSVTDANGKSANYTYLTNSLLVGKMVFSNAKRQVLTTTKTYDNVNRLTQIASMSLAGVASSHNYTYNQASQRTAATNELSEHWNYQYDQLGQVTNAWKFDSAGNVINDHRFSYQFDDIGNRQATMTGLLDGSSVGKDYTANLQNQYTAIGFTTPLYDADGNLTNDGNFTYVWDGENRLLGANSLATVTYTNPNDASLTYTFNTLNLSFTYDSQGRRIGKSVKNYANLSKFSLSFLYDGWNLIAIQNNGGQPGIYLPYSGTIRSELGPWVTATYLWGTDLSGSLQGAGGVGGLLAVNTDNNGSHFYCHDGNGNVMKMISAADGSETANYTYGAFGEKLSASGVMADLNLFCFSTKYLDAETGLYYYGYRYYDPVTGSWLSRDPIGEYGGLNLYGFVGNNPVNYCDLFGLKWLLKCVRCSKPDGTWKYTCGLSDDTSGVAYSADANDYPVTTPGSKGNQTSTTPGDSFGTGGPLEPGFYTVKIANFGHRWGNVPAISNGNNPPGDTVDSKGTKRIGTFFHPQYNLSKGCITIKDDKSFIQHIKDAIKADGGSVSLQIVDAGKCPDPCADCQKK